MMDFQVKNMRKTFMFGNLFLKKLLAWRWVGWWQDPVIKIEVQGRAKCSDLRGISGCFGATVGALMAVGVQDANLD